MFLKYLYLIYRTSEKEACDFHTPAEFVLYVFAHFHIVFSFVLLVRCLFHKAYNRIG